MEVYKKAYFKLFNAMTDIRTLLLEGRTVEAVEALMQAQIDGEEIIISDGE